MKAKQLKYIYIKFQLDCCYTTQRNVIPVRIPEIGV